MRSIFLITLKCQSDSSRYLSLSLSFSLTFKHLLHIADFKISKISHVGYCFGVFEEKERDRERQCVYLFIYIYIYIRKIVPNISHKNNVENF